MVFDIFKTNPRVAKHGLASQWTQVPRDVPFLGATWNMALGNCGRSCRTSLGGLGRCGSGGAMQIGKC